MRNRNVLVLAGAVLLIAVVALLSLIPQGQREVQVGSTIAAFETATPAPTETPASSEAPEATEAPAETPETAKAYLLVTVAGVLYEPIAIYEEGEYTVRRGEHENVIHVTPDSVYMASSTCENQDCVLQGTVSLDNMAERVLGNMIICLPNEVTLELYTPEGLAQAIVQYGEE